MNIVAEIKKHLQDEISDIAKYNLLAGRLPPEEAKVVAHIAQDESLHMSYLAAMLTLLAGWHNIYPYRSKIEIEAEPLGVVLRHSILEEKQTAEEYTKLLKAVRDSGTSYTVIEKMLIKMIKDEKRHAKILETIYRKHKL